MCCACAQLQGLPPSKGMVVWISQRVGRGCYFTLPQLQKKPELASDSGDGGGGRKGLKWLGSYTCAAAETLDGCQPKSWALAQAVAEGIMKGLSWLLSVKAFSSGAKVGDLCSGSMEVVLVIGLLTGNIC